MSINIADKAMLAHLSISMWTAKKNDKRVDREIAETHGTASNVVRSNKTLIAGTALAAMVTAAGDARTYHDSVTLPWMHKGPRILSAAIYFDVTNQMRVKRAAFESTLETFIAGYPEYVENARRSLNGLFLDADYPSISQLRRKFAFDFVVTPLPTANDFRVNLQAEEVAKVRADIEGRINETLKNAVQDVWTRIHEVVSRMSERLHTYAVDEKGKVVGGTFRDTLVTNVRELADLLPALNITGDAQLATMQTQLVGKLCAVDPQTLRDSPTARAEVAADADAILAQMAGYCAAA